VAGKSTLASRSAALAKEAQPFLQADGLPDGAA